MAGAPSRRDNGRPQRPCYRSAVVTVSARTPADPSSGASPGASRSTLDVRWLGRIDYRDAWALQKRLVAERAAGRIGDPLLLLEHPAGPDARPRTPTRATSGPTARELAARGHRGHPGRARRRGHLPRARASSSPTRSSRSAARGLLVRPFVRALEAALADDLCRASASRPDRRDGHPGCWCDPDGPRPRKIGALGLRVERGVSYHGIALNVTVDLRRLRADRSVRDARRRRRPRSPASCGEPATPPSTERPSSAPPGFAARSRPRSARRLRRGALSRWPPACSSCARTPITGWWVATVVDRDVPSRPVRAARPSPVDDGGDCQNCLEPAGDGVRIRMLKDLRVPRRRDGGRGARARARPRPGRPRRRPARRAAGGRSSPRRGEHRPLHAVGSAIDRRDARGRCRDAVAAARAAGQTDYLQVVQNWGAQAGARTNHLCLDLYDLPQIPHRVAEEIGGAARFVIREGECPFCRLVRDEPQPADRLVWEDAASVAFAPYASRSPFEVWIVPRRHEADFGRATRRRRRRHRRGAPPGPRPAGASLDGPPYNLVLHTAPLARAGRRDVPLALGDPPPPARDRRARARHRAAGQPGLARGGRRGAAGRAEPSAARRRRR